MKLTYKYLFLLTFTTAALASGPVWAFVLDRASIQKTDMDPSISGCFTSLLRSLRSDVPGLRFKDSCVRDPVTERYTWNFIYNGILINGDSENSLELCIAEMMTQLNLNVPLVDVSVNHRCHRNERNSGEPLYFWIYEVRSKRDAEMLTR